MSWNKSISGCNKEGGFEEPRFRVENSQGLFFFKVNSGKGPFLVYRRR